MEKQTILEYKGGNPDSPEAYFSIDISGPENEDVFVDNFVWNRKKSNENITDTRQGKGFSFYFARHVFDDEFRTYTYNEQNPENFKLLGVVYQNVIVLIGFEYEENDMIRIISAWEVEEDSQLSRIYRKNKEKNRKHSKNDFNYEIEKPNGNHFVSDSDKYAVYEAMREKLEKRKLTSKITN